MPSRNTEPDTNRSRSTTVCSYYAITKSHYAIQLQYALILHTRHLDYHIVLNIFVERIKMFLFSIKGEMAEIFMQCLSFLCPVLALNLFNEYPLHGYSNNTDDKQLDLDMHIARKHSMLRHT